jgi:hypothetical protein
MYLFVQVLLHIYAVSTWGSDESNGLRSQSSSTQFPGGPGGAWGGPSGSTSRRPTGRNQPPTNAPPRPDYPSHSRKPTLSNLDTYTHTNAYTYYDDAEPSPYMDSNPVNGKVGHRATASQQVRDAEEFELEGLMSEDDEGSPSGSGSGSGSGGSRDSGSGRKKEAGLDIAV